MENRSIEPNSPNPANKMDTLTESAILKSPTDALTALLSAVELSHGADGVKFVLEKIRDEIHSAPPPPQAEPSQQAPGWFGGFGGSNNSMQRVGAKKKRAEDQAATLALEKANEALAELLSSASILSTDLGKSHILEAAFVDGSSVVCQGCGGLIKRDRWDDHVELWCPVGDATGDDVEMGED